MNIRTRLTLQFFLLTAGIFLTALVFIHRQFEGHVEDEFFTLLESKARMTGEMVLNHEDDLAPITLPTEIPALPSTGNTAIFDKNLQCVFSLNRSEGFLDEETMFEIQKLGSCRLKKDGFFVFGFTLVTNTGQSFLVATKDMPDYSKLLELRNILLLSLFFIMAAVAMGGWFYAGQALRPVSRIVGEVDEILPTDLSRRLRSDNQHDEISHLVGTFNRLLDRIEHAFRMQRSFISNVSHELKNPLAAMDAQLQLARSKTRTSEEYGSVIDSIHDDVQELSDTTSKLLQLAKVNSDAQGIQFSEVRLDELLYQARAALLKTRPDATVLIEITDLPEDEGQLCIEGNEPLLRTALLNLFDNGCKFSAKNRVEVSIGFGKMGHPEIAIFNEGEHIPADELPRIFEPFFRSSKDISLKGSGIGLSLVQSIMQLHGIEMTVASVEKTGTTFWLKFLRPKNDGPAAAKKTEPVIEKMAGMPFLNIVQTRFALLKKPADKATDMAPTFFFKMARLFPAKVFLKNLTRAVPFFGLLFFTNTHCQKAPANETAEFRQAKAVLKTHNMTLLELVRDNEGYRPPVSSRMYAYMGLAAWESARPALPDAHSMAMLCPGIVLPDWGSGGDVFVLPVALDACYRRMAAQFFPHSTLNLSEKSRSRLRQLSIEIQLGANPDAVERSRKFGEAVALAMFKWSGTDTVGHQAYLFNYDKNYAPPAQKGCWQPTGENPMPALLPHWGRARTFAVPTAEVSAMPPKAFSEERGAAFFAEAMELYALSRPVSDENRWVAEFWSDDFPGVSFCAASRWVSIAVQAIEKKSPEFPVALETYLKLGLALNDAAVKCWAVKYEHNLERPASYIKRNITSNWEPLHDTPPFPTYPSGHATFGNAAATVFAQTLGNEIELTDRSHEGRKEFLGKPRHFHSFHDMAKENAISRLLLGVHFRMDCEEGFRLGGIIGKKVAELDVWESGKWSGK